MDGTRVKLEVELGVSHEAPGRFPRASGRAAGTAMDRTRVKLGVSQEAPGRGRECS